MENGCSFQGKSSNSLPSSGAGRVQEFPSSPISSDEKFAIVDAPQEREKKGENRKMCEDVSLLANGQNTPAVVL